MIVTYLLDTHTLPDPVENPELLDGLPQERIEKIRRLKHTESRKQSLGAGLLLEHGLRQAAEYAGEGHQQAAELSSVIEYGAFGKPHLAEGAPFNLSHTGSYAIVSIMLSKENAAPDKTAIGCDIEQVRKYDPRLARRFFTGTEYQILEGTDADRQADMFCRYWTRKESVLKLTGLGMSLPLDLFEISSGNVAVPDEKRLAAWQASAEGKAQAEAYGAAGELLRSSRVQMREYRYKDCWITVCSTHDQFAPQIVAVM